MKDLFFEKAILVSIIASSEVLLTYMLDNYLEKNVSEMRNTHKNLIRVVVVFVMIFLLTLVLMYTVRHFFGIRNP